MHPTSYSTLRYTVGKWKVAAGDVIATFLFLDKQEFQDNIIWINLY